MYLTSTQPAGGLPGNRPELHMDYVLSVFTTANVVLMYEDIVQANPDQYQGWPPTFHDLSLDAQTALVRAAAKALEDVSSELTAMQDAMEEHLAVLTARS